MANGYAQPGVPEDPYKNINPLLLLGVFIFIVPFLKDVIGIGLPGILWKIISGIGILLIIVGGLLSALQRR